MPHDWKAASLNDVSKVVREVDYRAVINTKNLMETREELNQLKLLPNKRLKMWNVKLINTQLQQAIHQLAINLGKCHHSGQDHQQHDQGVTKTN